MALGDPQSKPFESHYSPAPISFRGILASLMAAWYTNVAMITAFFIKSSIGMVSKKSRLV
jgi:hypothetical protein